jgi:hypothetical protein
MGQGAQRAALVSFALNHIESNGHESHNIYMPLCAQLVPVVVHTQRAGDAKITPPKPSKNISSSPVLSKPAHLSHRHRYQIEANPTRPADHCS